MAPTVAVIRTVAGGGSAAEEGQADRPRDDSLPEVVQCGRRRARAGKRPAEIAIDADALQSNAIAAYLSNGNAGRG